ncbi:MAG: hypothetical protein IH977_00700 [Nitrospinae bacterium]|nr:hypothetical protein [Nitrospinota bacterium]
MGEGGTILATTDAGQTWTKQTSGTRIRLQAVAFVSPTQGWAVGRDGTILITTDAGQTWTPQTSGTRALLFDVAFVSPTQGWAVGAVDTDPETSTSGLTILLTKDGGTTWEPVHYRWYPAPWYWFVGWVFPLGLLYLGLRGEREPEKVEKSVAGALVSDRPLEAGDPDPLGFQTIAGGLSRFLRHEKTQPPLTIAITGDWGTGKSSLMNLLKADLEKYGFRPVWFNAWHHQKEEHLLASLLESVRTHAIPPWWRLANWRFRTRLLFLRTKKHWVPILVLAVLFGFSAGYLWTHPDQKAEFHNTPFGPEMFSTLVDYVEKNFANSTSLLTLLVTSVTALGAILRGLVAFGVKPASLLASLSGKSSVRILTAKTGFRQAFATEFHEVSRALMPKYFPIVMIDDLDRCRPDKVLEVLEAVNFLVASGDCVVVMGLALERVEGCVGLGFKDVAEELVDEDEAPSGQNAMAGTGTEKEVAREKRAAFARQYLEKLINIEVPVPTPTEKDSAGLVESMLEQVQPWDRALTFFQQTRAFTRKLLPTVGVVFVIALSVWAGTSLFPPETKYPGISTGSKPIQPAVQSDEYAQPIPPDNFQTTPPPPEDEKGKADLVPGEESQWPVWPASFLLVFVAAGIWLMVRPDDVVVQDSSEFETALKMWTPVIQIKNNTPRSIKRLVNRVRYLAMLQQRPEDVIGRWARLLSRLGYQPRPDVKQADSDPRKKKIPESFLVALSAIHHHDGALIEEEGNFLQQVMCGFAKSSSFDNGVAVLQKGYEDHKAKETPPDGFPPWTEILNYREIFLERFKGIRMG